jgi:hypothetical protein
MQQPSLKNFWLYYLLGDEETRNTTFILTGNIESGLPPFQPPPFSLNDTETGNVTSFGGMISELGSAIAIIPLLGILENVAIAKAFGNLTIEFITAVYSNATKKLYCFFSS